VVGLPHKVKGRGKRRTDIYEATEHAACKVVYIGEIAHKGGLHTAAPHSRVHPCEAPRLLVGSEEVYIELRFCFFHL